MRLAPLAIFYSGDFKNTVKFVAENSKLTHQAVEAVDCCRYFSALLYGALNGETKKILLSDLYSPIPGYWDENPLTDTVRQIALGSYKKKSREQISSSGYVIHTLEAALWAFYRNDDFRTGALEAVNLAGDSDTVGAVYGQLAGAYCGETNIPIEWITSVYRCQAPYHFVEDMTACMNSSL